MDKLFSFLLENCETFLFSVAIVLANVFGRPKTAEKLKKAREKHIEKLKKKGEKQAEKLQSTAKKLEELTEKED